MAEIFVAKYREVNIRRDGNNVVLISGGQRVLELPWDAALALGKALIIQTRRIEERVKADSIAFDQAILMRRGLPFGLSSNPTIIDMAKKEAAHNSVLRRNVPKAPGVDSKEAFGTPTLIKHRRKNNGERP